MAGVALALRRRPRPRPRSPCAPVPLCACAPVPLCACAPVPLTAVPPPPAPPGHGPASARRLAPRSPHKARRPAPCPLLRPQPHGARRAHGRHRGAGSARVSHPGQVMTRYYGWYASRTRGTRARLARLASDGRRLTAEGISVEEPVAITEPVAGTCGPRGGHHPHPHAPGPEPRTRPAIGSRLPASGFSPPPLTDPLRR